MNGPTKAPLGGYTFLETLVGMIILTLVGGLVLGTLLQTRQFTERSLDQLEQQRELQSTLVLLENLTRRTTPPVWVSPQPYLEIAPEKATFPWLDGEKEKTWSLSNEKDTLVITEGSFVWTVKMPLSGTWEPWISNDRPAGLQFTFRWGPQTYTLKWPWGSRPL